MIKVCPAASPKWVHNHSICLPDANGKNLINAEDIANSLYNYVLLSEKNLPKTLKNLTYFLIHTS